MNKFWNLTLKLRMFNEQTYGIFYTTTARIHILGVLFCRQKLTIFFFMSHIFVLIMTNGY